MLYRSEEFHDSIRTSLISKIPEGFVAIPDYPDYYINLLGELLSIRRSGVKKLNPRLRSGTSYPYATLCNKDGQANKSIHRLLAQLFIPNPENLPYINHKNGNKKDFRLENLEWVTASQNLKHAFATGLSKVGDRKGEANHANKLAKEQVLRIRAEYRPKQVGSSKALAEEFNVSQSLIRRVYKRQLWSHL